MVSVACVGGMFGGLFDLDRDGELNAGEFALMQEVVFGDLNKSSDDFDEDDEYDEIEEAGLDYDELEEMDEDERREALEDAGLDPDDYDF